MYLAVVVHVMLGNTLPIDRLHVIYRQMQVEMASFTCHQSLRLMRAINLVRYGSSLDLKVCAGPAWLSNRIAIR
jgi:hypothetical protein